MTNPRRLGRPFHLCRHSSMMLLLPLAWLAIVFADRAFAEAAQSAANPIEFNIPAQSVPDALSEFARQASVQLFFISDGFEDIEANAVVGTYPTQQALNLLLEGTGLAARISSNSGVKVRAIGASTESPTLNSQLFAAAMGDTMVGRQAPEHDGPERQQSGRTHTAAAGQERMPDAPIEEIVVTGSNIRGVEAVGADVITLDRAYIEMSGIATTTELIQSLPQNFGIGNEAVEAVGAQNSAGINWGFSSSVDLRGLGSDSTLVLLNGRRVASGGGSGNFVDLNSIPTAAIDRIDVLPDGASAIYGSDAVGGVVNVILREDFEGAETRLRYAPGSSDIDEVQFSQVLSKSWNTGNILFNYEYYDRSALQSADRAYTRDSDLTPLGGSNYSTTLSNPGNIDQYTLADGATIPVSFAIPAEQDGTGLTPADLLPGDTNIQNINEGTHVLPEQARGSALLSARQEVADTIDLFVEARYSNRDFEFLNQDTGRTLIVPSSNAFFVDSFGNSQSLRIRYSKNDDYGPTRSAGEVKSLGAVLGAMLSLGSSWALEVSGSYGSEDTYRRVDQTPNSALLAIALADSDPATAFNPFGDGSFTNPATLAAIEGFDEVEVDSELSTLNLRVAGDVFDLPGGAAKLAIGAELRDQSLSSDNTRFLFSVEPETGFERDIFKLDRNITAAFAEIYLPLVSDQNSRRGMNKLALSVAARFERYSDFGNTSNPKLGVTWSPNGSFQIRSTVGTSFRAPLLTELNTANNSVSLFNLPAPTPSGSAPVIFLSGNSPDLTPQEGETWTAGLDFTPTLLPGLKIGLTYFDTVVDDVIQVPSRSLEVALLDPVGNAPILTICPCNAEIIAGLFNDPSFADLSGGTLPGDVGAILDGRVRNVLSAEVTGLDLNMMYSFDTTFGNFKASLYASHMFKFTQQLEVNSSLVDRVDTIANPNSLNLRSSLYWSRGGFNIVVTNRYIGDYVNDLGTPSCAETPCAVSSWTTWDLLLGYDFADRFPGLLDGTRLSLSVQNVFDRNPPFVEVASAAVGFDAINANPMGQFAALQLVKTW